jgi:hypothetical protein
MTPGDRLAAAGTELPGAVEESPHAVVAVASRRVLEDQRLHRLEAAETFAVSVAGSLLWISTL